MKIVYSSYHSSYHSRGSPWRDSRSSRSSLTIVVTVQRRAVVGPAAAVGPLGTAEAGEALRLNQRHLIISLVYHACHRHHNQFARTRHTAAATAQFLLRKVGSEFPLRCRSVKGLLAPFGGRVLQRLGGGSLPKISAPAASVVTETLVHGRRKTQTLGFMAQFSDAMVLQMTI